MQGILSQSLEQVQGFAGRNSGSLSPTCRKAAVDQLSVMAGVSAIAAISSWSPGYGCLWGSSAVCSMLGEPCEWCVGEAMLLVGELIWKSLSFSQGGGELSSGLPRLSSQFIYNSTQEWSLLSKWCSLFTSFGRGFSLYFKPPDVVFTQA